MRDGGTVSPRARALRRAAGLLLALLVLGTVVALVARSGEGSSLPPVEVPEAATEGTIVSRYPLRSRAAGRRLVQTVVAPPGGTRGRPLLVLLHGKAQDPATLAGAPLRAALKRLGPRAPVVLLPADDGGSYWHDRQTGRWGGYVLDEAIPTAVRRLGVDGTRVAIGGISMGGSGAFALARRAPGRFCAVGGHSAALWLSAAAAAPGAYDDRADFRRHDPVAPVRAGRVRYRVPLWLDAGDADPFRGAQRVFAAALRRNGERVAVRVWEGGHEQRYWDRHLGAYLRFYGDALARCRR
ncbi:alpha/beta hydrolase-fold protein [Patulibacter defluvii]|uniref:alpha/beta hydrolase-fold protein n=1 Tax=Patulibacter defluvii TaxID=3095358 RepID=UPI002A756CE8|nr:alpha/beta hydrolase-fold protein [Patulibacter sp. DM4]